MSALLTYCFAQAPAASFFVGRRGIHGCCHSRRGVLQACSRPLELYRDGSRSSSRRTERKRPANRFPPTKRRAPQRIDLESPNVPKTRVTLVKALSRANVAAYETCNLLIRSGRVELNGVLSTERDRMIDTTVDIVAVNGREINFFPTEDGDDDDDADEFEDEASLTRMEKDFRNGRFAQKCRLPRDKKFSRKIDGGFLSSRVGKIRS